MLTTWLDKEWLRAEYGGVHNIGVFIGYAIAKGTKIHIPDAKEMRDTEYAVLVEFGADKESFLTTDDKIYDVRNTLLRFLNHSDNPNMDWENGLNLIALEDITENTELTINYGWDEYKWKTKEK